MPILFLKLDLFAIFPMLLYRAAGYRVFFLDCSEFWRRGNRYLKVGRLGIQWINHQESDTARFGTVMRDCHRLILLIGGQLIQSRLYGALVEAISPSVNLTTCIHELVHTIIRQPLELVHTGHSLRFKAHNNVVLLWLPNTKVTQLLLECFPGTKNLCPRFWSALDLTVAAALPTLAQAPKMLVSRLGWLKRLTVMGTHSTLAAEHLGQSIEQNASFLKEARVAYFPHMGVMYSHLYAKDHFYADDRLSPFHRSNIVHFEQLYEHAAGSIDYYKQYQIKNYEWQSLNFDRSSALHAVKDFARSVSRIGWNNFDFELFLKLTRICWNIETSRSRLSTLPNLKVVLVGSDIAFPQSLAVACTLSNITTVASQERMVSAWWMHPLLFDHYFIAGEASYKYLKSTSPDTVHYHLVGPMRIDKHRNAVVPDCALNWRAKFQAIVLALDMHSEKSVFENGRALGNNWRINSRFYRDLLQLTRLFPDFLFLLKGKNVDFLDIPYFDDVMNSLCSQPNFLILEDNEKWTPFNSVAVSDVCIARHTSLADEMLALGKPVVFHDTYGFPTEVFDYGRAITKNDLEGLKSFFEEFRDNRAQLLAKIAGIRCRLFSDPGQHFSQTIKTVLDLALVQKDAFLHDANRAS